MDDVKQSLEHCLNLSNAYRQKHKELQIIYKAYKELYSNTTSECLLKNIIKTMDDITKLNNCKKEIFSKKEFYEMLKTQSKIMSEVKDINSKINEYYPNF